MQTLANFTKHRNYGCRIKEYEIDGIKTVSLENDLIKVVILAGKGTDIVEFVFKPKDMDFLWHSFNGIRNPANFMNSCESPGGSFLDLYEGGWQELFPNIGNSCDYKGARLGIHGVVCNIRWDYSIERDEVDDISVRFYVHTIRTPFYLEKTLTLKLHDPVLYMDESITNEGAIPLEFMWGHHPVFGPMFLDDSCRIDVKGDVKIITDEKSGILKSNSEYDWPVAEDKEGNSIDISQVKHPDSKQSIACALSEMDSGEYRIINTNYKLGFGMKWDKKLFPHLWIWEPNCADDHSPWFGRNYVLGLEPWTAIPQDFTAVIEQDKGVKIQSGETISTKIQAFAFEGE